MNDTRYSRYSGVMKIHIGFARNGYRNGRYGDVTPVTVRYTPLHPFLHQKAPLHTFCEMMNWWWQLVNVDAESGNCCGRNRVGYDEGRSKGGDAGGIVERWGWWLVGDDKTGERLVGWRRSILSFPRATLCWWSVSESMCGEWWLWVFDFSLLSCFGSWSQSPCLAE